MAKKSGRIISAALFFLLTLYGVPHLERSGAAELEEYKVKMAFIFNFAKFIEWPANAFQTANTPIVMCILGDDPFGNATAEFENKMIGDKKFIVRRAYKVEETQGCHIVFIGLSEKDRLDHVLRVLKGAGILTVSDIPNFTRIGGMIRFTTSGDKIRFEINLSNARSSKLVISSKLLKLAETVRED